MTTTWAELPFCGRRVFAFKNDWIRSAAVIIPSRTPVCGSFFCSQHLVRSGLAQKSDRISMRLAGTIARGAAAWVAVCVSSSSSVKTRTRTAGDWRRSVWPVSFQFPCMRALLFLHCARIMPTWPNEDDAFSFWSTAQLSDDRFRNCIPTAARLP